MSEMIALFRGALVLDTKTFLDLRASPDVFRKGFMFLVVIGLIVGLVVGLVGVVRGLTTNPAAEISQVREGIEQGMMAFAQQSGMPPQAIEQMRQNMDMGFRIAERIVSEMRTPFPRPVGVIFEQMGAVVSQPFGWLGSLLFYGVLVQFFAVLLGGRGTIAQMWGLSSLTVAPHLLDALLPILGLIPVAGGCLGFLVGLVAFVWGVVIYVKGTAVAHEMSGGKALLAVLLPIILAILLVLLFILLIVVLILLGGGGGR